MAESITQEALIVTGMAGATAASRYAGATASGAPTTGTFAVGDFVVDQTGAMYVCTVAGTPGTWQLSGVSVNENIAGKNFIINGGMDIWQRATSATYSIAGYLTADRWYVYTGGPIITPSQVTVASGLPNGFQYAMRQQRASGQTSTGTLYLTQSLETKNSLPLAGQTVTFSFWARCGSGFTSPNQTISTQIIGGTGTDQNVINGYTNVSYPVNATVYLTQSWQRFSYTGTYASSINEAAINFSWGGVGTAGAADYFDITGVQLEIAPQATPFSRAGGSIGAELALCQRYFYRLGTNSAYETYLLGAPNGNQIVMPIQFPVTMRTAPSVTTSAGSTFACYASTPTGTPSVYSHLSANSCTILINTVSTPPVYFVQDNGSGNSYIFCNAEL